MNGATITLGLIPLAFTILVLALPPIDWQGVALMAQLVLAVLVALGLKEAAAAALRRFGRNAVDKAARTPDKRDDETAALIRDTLDAIANKLDAGGGDRELADLARAAARASTPPIVAHVAPKKHAEAVDALRANLAHVVAKGPQP